MGRGNKKGKGNILLFNGNPVESIVFYVFSSHSKL